MCCLISGEFDVSTVFCSIFLLRLQICDMVAIARYLNVTLIVPELDKTSFWADPRCVNYLSKTSKFPGP